MRAIGRLIYWGELAGAITVINIQNFDEIKQILDNSPFKHNLEDKRYVNWTVTATFLMRLRTPAMHYVDEVRDDKRNRWKASSLAFRITFHKWFRPVYLILVIVIFVVLLLASWAHLL